MANESMWNGATLTISTSAGGSAAFSGTYESIGPYSEETAVADITPVSQVTGYKQKIASAVKDAGTMSGVVYFNEAAALPIQDGRRRAIVFTVSPTSAPPLTTTAGDIEGTGFITGFEIGEATKDGAKMATITITWEGGTNVLTAGATASSSTPSAPSWTPAA